MVQRIVQRGRSKRDDLTNNEVDDLQQGHPRSPHNHTELSFGRDRPSQFRVIADIDCILHRSSAQ